MGGAADLERELAESRAREAALAEVLGVMRRAPGELPMVLGAVLDRAASLCGAERASIHLLDGDVYRTAAFWGPPNPEYERVAYDTTRKPGRETLIGRTAAERAVIHIPDVLIDPDYTANDLQRLAGYRTMLGVPLFRGETVAGVFVLTRNEVRPFSDREIGLVHAFADQAVVAVENARLIKGTNEALERQTAISEVLKDMSRSAFDLDRVLESVAINAVRLCAADNGSIAQLRSDGWRLVANVGDIDPQNMERNWGNQPIEANRRSLTGRVLMDRKTTTIVDAQADPEYDAGVGIFNVRSLIGVPLTRGDEIVGVLILRRSEPRPFTPEHIDLLETFADQASVAIENVRLFNETKEALETQTAIGDVLGVLSRSAFDLEPMLGAITDNAKRLIGASVAVIWRVEGERMSLAAATAINPAWIQRYEGIEQTVDSGFITRHVVRSKAIFHTLDAQAEADTEDSRISAKLGNYHTALGVPLMRDDQVVGVLSLTREEMRAFTEREVEIVRTFADQAVIAMENVRLFKETKESLERQTALAEILQMVSKPNTDLHTIADAVARSAARYCAAENATVSLVEGDSYRIVAFTGALPNQGPELQPITRLTVNGRALLEARTIHVADLWSSDDYPGGRELAIRLGFHTGLVTPILRGERAIGTITLRRKELRPFNDREISLLEAFAAQGAIAIENVRLFSETKESLEQQTAVSEVLEAISRSAFDLQSVFEVVLENAKNLCRGDWSYLFRREGDVFRLVASSGGLPELIEYE
ncbi:MAG TPA: GAF domain-containing protein, partial [Candidatus Limnocylindria bacterium]|nr:GAF domain-containing protein [Candidatus Limnocylindria bacterium]